MLALVALVGFAPAAQAYPEVLIDLTAKPTVLYGGETFNATATANVTCEWNLEWNGVNRDDVSDEFTTTFTAPQVTKVTEIPLHGTCDYALPAGATPAARSARASIATDTTWNRTIQITVLPRGSAAPPESGGNLPNTGGPSLWLLIAGIALAAGGATAVFRSRAPKSH